MIVCHARALTADAATVEALARLQLAARRRGARFRVCNASAELQALLSFLGLSQLLGVEAGGEAEQREQGGGVKEEGQIDDPAV